MTKPRRGRAPLVADKRYAAPASRKQAGRSGAGGGTSEARRKPRSRKPKRSGGFFSTVLRFFARLLWGLAWRGAMVVALLVSLGVGFYYLTLPEANALLDGRARGSVTLLDRDGEVFAWRGDQFGGVVTADTVSPHLKHAVIATEDRRYYRHLGISPRGIASAIRINLREGRGPLSGHGGSTITQQTAKLLCLGVPYDPNSGQTERAYEAECRETTLWRKVKEALYALALEVKYSKDQILTIYLNRAYLGEGARGFEAASQRYFGKSAASVTPAEAAMLAGLLKAPTRYAPTNNLELARDRAAVIVTLMREQGYLSQSAADRALSAPADLSDAAAAQAGGYFADWVMGAGPDFFTKNTTEDVIIRTTLDPRIQAAAEAAISSVFSEMVAAESKAQAAIVVMSADGAVRAMVGGRKTKVSGAFNRATQALRQTGSAFKPFVYATALDLGYGPMDTVVDEPYCLDIPGSGEWCPKNYTNEFYGRVTLADALKNSLNIPAVKVSESVGREKVRLVAAQFGIESDLALGPALALGASESTLIEMTGAYAGILNGGSSVTPYGLVELRLLGDEAPLMGAGGGIGERVISEDAARNLIAMMERVVSEGTGRRAALPGWQVAGKTGTTQAARDAWFIGFTADYVAGVWMGYDDNTPLTGVTGGGLPAEIWRAAMQPVHEGRPPYPLPMSADMAFGSAREMDPPVSRAPARGDSLIESLLRGILSGGDGTAPPSGTGTAGGDR